MTDGYRLGWRWIREAPAAFLRRVAVRLDIAWRGAALGWTGRGVPWGLAGERRAVDLTVPTGAGFALWRALLLGTCLVGAWRGRRAPILHLWLLFAAAKLAAAAGFFGYARHGATLIPVVAALAALAAVGPAARAAAAVLSRRALRIAGLVALLGIGVEAQRYLRPPTLLLDGREVGARDPYPLGEHLDRRVELSP